MLKKIAVLVTISVGLLIGCSDNSSSDSTSSQTSQTVWEQKSQMLTNWADNFIIPNYQNLYDKLSELETTVANFNATPNTWELKHTNTRCCNTRYRSTGDGAIRVGKAKENAVNTQLYNALKEAAEIEDNRAVFY